MNKKQAILRQYGSDPEASHADIAKKTGSSESYVNKVLAGRRHKGQTSRSGRDAATQAAV